MIGSIGYFFQLFQALFVKNKHNKDSWIRFHSYIAVMRFTMNSYSINELLKGL